jgi:hypothetical protein
MLLADRDLLALRASERSVASHPGVTTWFGAAQPVPDGAGPFDVITAILPHQQRPAVMEYWLDTFIEHLEPGGSIVVGGGSTEVSRWIAFARKRSGVKLRGREKRKGFSAAVLQRP